MRKQPFRNKGQSRSNTVQATLFELLANVVKKSGKAILKALSFLMLKFVGFISKLLILPNFVGTELNRFCCTVLSFMKFSFITFFAGKK